MLTSLVFPEPKPVFEIDPADIAGISKVLNNRTVSVAKSCGQLIKADFVASETLSHKKANKLFRLTRNILCLAATEFDRKVGAIELDCMETEPGHTQRSSSRWHTDGNRGIIARDDSLPTQTAVGEVGINCHVAEAYRAAKGPQGGPKEAQVFNHAVDEAISNGILELKEITPYTAYLIDGVVHRSQTNQQPDTVNSCFIRLNPALVSIP